MVERRELLWSGTNPYVSTICLCHRTWPDFPGLPLPYLHTVSDQILEVGTACEQGFYWYLPLHVEGMKIPMNTLKCSCTDLAGL